MRLISLNIWGGRVYEPLINFVKNQARNTDIFCFQEVFSTIARMAYLPSTARTDIFNRLSDALPGFKELYFPASESYDMGMAHVDLDFTAGHAFFIRKNISVGEFGSFYTHTQSPITHTSGFVSYVHLPKVTIVNIHGLWTGKGKNDNPERLEQTRILKKFLNSLSGKKVLCGDFNLNPDTQSLIMLEHDMKNLIKEHKVQTTRSPLYKHFDEMKFADYTFVSPDVNVKDFQVPNITVSDHLPMILEFQ